MSRKGLLITSLFILSMLLGVFTGLHFGKKESADFSSADEIQISRESPAPTFIQTEKPKTEASVSEKYMLTLTDTQIMLYKIGSDGGMQVIDEKPIDKNGLRREDFEKLYKGITFDTMSEARETLEDYIN